MKTNSRLGLTVLLIPLILAGATNLAAAASSGTSTVGVGVRQHGEHSAIPDMPFDDGDYSYGVAMEWHEASAYWQIAVNYAPDTSGNDLIDYLIIPQLNLIMKDNFWQGGLGILKPYAETEVEGGDWLDLYWQFILGIQIPLGGMQLSAHSFYVFDGWDNLGEFDVSDIEYGVWLTFDF